MCPADDQFTAKLRLLEKLPDDQRKKQLHQLMLEWNADIATGCCFSMFR